MLPSAPHPPLPTTEGTLLGGRVHHTQPATGHRTGLEPVLLAASIPARPGQAVLEGGTGAGAALLCLATRLPGITGLGVERDPVMAALALHNVAANDLPNLAVAEADLLAFTPASTFDHAMANPPWHTPSATASPDHRRDAARRASPGLFIAWAQSLTQALRPRGTLTFVLGADHLHHGLAALAAAGCGSPAIFPLWPKPGRPAKLVLLRGIRAGRGPARMLAGLTLHEPNGTFTQSAQTILRDGAALAF